MNKVVTPNTASIAAFDAWRQTVLRELDRQHISKSQLARCANVERKTIYAWLDGDYIPRLDSVAQIFAVLGFDEIKLPLTFKEEDEQCT